MTRALPQTLANGRVLDGEDLDELVAAARASGAPLEALLAERGVPRHEVLRRLAETHGCPFLEYDESVAGPREIVRRIDPGTMRRGLWFPLSVEGNTARVVAWDPGVASEVRKVLGVALVDFAVALPSDVLRIIEHNLDLNPGFPLSGGRTPLAKVRTFLARRRSECAAVRTSLARGRTGLAVLRSGLSFVAIAIVLHRVLGLGPHTILEVALAAAGVHMVVEGLRWYLPARASARRPLALDPPAGTGGTTVLEVGLDGEDVSFARSDPVEGAAELRAAWSDLSPVMRRRFLASDRTDLAEERTYLAVLRTRMARARTGLAFTRTGIASAGLGIALFRTRQLQTGAWPLFDALVVLSGAAMIAEGLLWYFMDRRAGVDGHDSVRSSSESPGVWEWFFPPRHAERLPGTGLRGMPAVGATHAPGIWGTTGLALERTVLAERRNVMARLRTVMARSRTGLAFVRTGIALCGVGGALLVYFGAANAAWAALEVAVVVAGVLLVADGLWWHLPAEKVRRQLPYCTCDVEIASPDYGKPARGWRKAVFSHDDL